MKKGPFSPELKEGEHKVRFLNWNVLDKDKADQNPTMGFPLVDEIVLSPASRFPKIAKYIFDSGADIITLQEVSDTLIPWITDWLPTHDHTPRNVSGDMIFWRKDMFVLSELHIEKYAEHTATQRITAVILNFKKSKTGETMFVATTHMKAKRQYANVRNAQARRFVERCRVLAQNANYGVVGMDLNDEPESEAFHALTKDMFMSSMYGPWAMFGKDDESQIHANTTMKYRYVDGKLSEDARCSDYIFTVGGSMQMLCMELGVLDDIAETYKEKGLPDNKMPSDHVPLHATFYCYELSPRNLNEETIQNVLSGALVAEGFF